MRDSREDAKDDSGVSSLCNGTDGAAATEMQREISCDQFGTFGV